MPAGITFAQVGKKIPTIMLTSSFNDTLLLICRLVVRRTFLCSTPDSLELRRDRYAVDLLQCHARMLFHLLGIWIVGEPYPTPNIDEESRHLVDHVGSPERTAEGHGINWVKAGLCLFEALHEFSHVLTGDWLRPPETWTAEDEVRADRFASSCLLLEEEPIVKAWMLRGAHLSLILISLVERFYGRSGRHPGAHERAKQMYEFIRPRLTLDELRLFDLLDELEALPAFCVKPSKYGALYGDLFGE